MDRPPASPEAALADFRRWYTDPVLVNGTSVTAAEMASRADALRRTFADIEREVLNVVDGGKKVAIAFRMGGPHVGPLHTSAGILQPTGKTIMLRIIDILTLRNGKIAEITMVADELDGLAAANAIVMNGEPR